MTHCVCVGWTQARPPADIYLDMEKEGVGKAYFALELMGGQDILKTSVRGGNPLEV